jgi:hypothetical protein
VLAKAGAVVDAEEAQLAGEAELARNVGERVGVLTDAEVLELGALGEQAVQGWDRRVLYG